MSKRSERARRRKEQRTRENLELNKAKAEIHKPDANEEGTDPKQHEAHSSAITHVMTNDVPAATSKSKEDRATEKRKYAKYIMWPFVTIWRVLFTFLDRHSGSITALATVAIVVLTYVYVKYSKKQWSVAQESLNVSQRAYVAIGRKDGVVAKFISSNDPKQNAELVVYFQNSGHLPAQFAWGTIGLNLLEGASKGQTSSGMKYTHPFTGISRSRDKKTGTINNRGDWTFIPGESVFLARIGEIPQDQFAHLRSNNTGLLIMGRYQYCDQMGTDVHHDFSLGFQNAPDADLNFYLASDTESPYSVPASADEIEYLPPCKTLKEH